MDEHELDLHIYKGHPGTNIRYWRAKVFKF